MDTFSKSPTGAFKTLKSNVNWLPKFTRYGSRGLGARRLKKASLFNFLFTKRFLAK